MDETTNKDLEAIEDLHRRDVAAMKAGDYEQGIVRYAVRDANGTIFRETQRLMRLQPDGQWRVLRAMWHAPRRASEETDENE